MDDLVTRLRERWADDDDLRDTIKGYAFIAYLFGAAALINALSPW